MFDLRYHVASLAAVFLALVVGILIGVGLTTQGVISTSERKVLNQRISDLQNQRDSARQRASDLNRAKRVADAYVKRTYPALMAGRLTSTRVAVLFAGATDGRLRSEIEETLTDAGSRGSVRLRSLKVPLELRRVNRTLASRGFTRYLGQPGKLGSALADELVLGGRTPLWDALSRQLVGDRAGKNDGPVDAVVVARPGPAQMQASAHFLSGIYNELVGLGVPVVGVEDTDSPISAVETFRRHGVSSVDDLDTAAGRLALAVVLAGGQSGHYGVKRSADDLLPPVTPIEPVSRTTTSD